MRCEPGTGMGRHWLPSARSISPGGPGVPHVHRVHRAGRQGQPADALLLLERIERALNDNRKPVKGSRLFILGASYKRGDGDIRESPALRIMELLAQRGAVLSYHDPVRPRPPTAWTEELEPRRGRNRRCGGPGHAPSRRRPSGPVDVSQLFIDLRGTTRCLRALAAFASNPPSGWLHRSPGGPAIVQRAGCEMARVRPYLKSAWSRRNHIMSGRIERRVELPITLERAWQAVTDPDWLALWLADDIHLDPRPGGEAHFQIGAETRSGWVEGCPRLMQGTGRLAFWWAADDEPASRVELTVSEVATERTVLRVVESRPLDVLDLMGTPLPGHSGTTSGPPWSPPDNDRRYLRCGVQRAGRPHAAPAALDDRRPTGDGHRARRWAPDLAPGGGEAPQHAR